MFVSFGTQSQTLNLGLLLNLMWPTTLRLLIFSSPNTEPCVVSYYLADGVKLFSQETWRMFMRDAGRDMVGKYAADVTDYYCMASELDNHCVRESACHSIAEMAEKVCQLTHGAWCGHVVCYIATMDQCCALSFASADATSAL